MSTDSKPAPLPELEGVFGRYGPGVSCASAVILVLLISAIDQLTGYDLHLGILHPIPIAIATWAAGRTWGMVLSLAAIAIWLLLFRAHHASFSYYWDAAVQLGTFTVVVMLLAKLREALQESDARFVKVLEKLDAAVYVADPERREVLYGNTHFREALSQLAYDALAQLPGKETRLRWPDGRRVVLRILSG